MMDKSYEPKSFETRWYQHWEESGCFKPSGKGPAYTIMLPPPNVTGTLHMGHAFQHTIQDALIRYHRMRGFDTLWQMGTDHAGIATEMVVSRNLAIKNIGETRDSLGREKFIEKVWEWKAESGGTIERQMRRLGSSGDWSRSVFTMDAMPSDAVIETFVRLFEEGLIYRGKKLVNWDPVLNTAISDLEVENREVPGHMWHFKYPLADGQTYEYIERDKDGNITLRETRDYISIATTRPETMLGDGAVAVHPSDARYTPIVGKLCEIPVGPKAQRRLIPIIVDEYPDPEFGSGAVKITGAHDFNDYAVAERNNIPLYALMDNNARMRTDGLSYADSAAIAARAARGEKIENVFEVNLVPEELRGLDRYEARKRVIEVITTEGLAVLDANGEAVVESKTIMQPFGDRSGTVIEPMLTDQWFVRMEKLGAKGLQLVENGSVKFVPENWINTYRHWMENIQDWCISRQLWWGHRIPAWYDESGNVYVARDANAVRQQAEASVGAAQAANLRQDSDVLETWFSSALWSHSTLGWPNKTLMQERGYDRYLPTSVLVTGFDIIFFWVARMIMMTDHFTGQVPFKEVYITGLVRDKDGQKMSKSKGNILDPLDIIDGIELDTLIAKRTGGLMQPKMAEKIEKATRKEFPEGIQAFGADALRFTFASLASHGRDIKFDLNRCEGYKNFCNKLWNAARFVLMNCEGFTASGALNPQTDAERWILHRLQQTLVEVKTHYADYRFDLLSQSLYEFTWNEFCDWFLELAKPALNGDNAEHKASTQHTLLYVLENTLRALHPVIPFVTEEIWQHVSGKLSIAGNSISTQIYPEAESRFENTRAADDIEWLKAAVTQIRSIRSQLNVPPSKLVPLLVEGKDPEIISRHSASLKFLARLESIESVGSQIPASSAAVLGELKLHIPLAGLIDVDAERARLDKEIKRVETEIAKCQNKLSSETFVQNAPPAVVEQERKRLEEWSTQLSGLREQRQRI
jgi:valyl-tRNA synthetase